MSSRHKPTAWIYDLIANTAVDNGNNGQITWNSQYVQLVMGWEFSRAGRYDYPGNYPAEPPNQSGSDAIYFILWRTLAIT